MPSWPSSLAVGPCAGLYAWFRQRNFWPCPGKLHSHLPECLSTANPPTPAHQPGDEAKESAYSGELATLFRIKKDPGSPTCPPEGSTCAQSVTTWSRQEDWMPNHQGKCIGVSLPCTFPARPICLSDNPPPCPPGSLPEANVPLLKPHAPLMRLEWW